MEIKLLTAQQTQVMLCFDEMTGAVDLVQPLGGCLELCPPQAAASIVAASRELHAR